MTTNSSMSTDEAIEELLNITDINRATNEGSDSGEQIKKEVIEAVAETSIDNPEKTQPAIKNIIALLDDNSAEVRTYAAKALAELASEYPEEVKPAEDQLVKLSDTPIRYQKASAIMALSQLAMNHPETVSVSSGRLTSNLTDNHSKVRAGSAKILATIGRDDPAAVKPATKRLVKCLDSHFKHEKTSAALALYTILRKDPDAADISRKNLLEECDVEEIHQLLRMDVRTLRQQLLQDPEIQAETHPLLDEAESLLENITNSEVIDEPDQYEKINQVEKKLEQVRQSISGFDGLEQEKRDLQEDIRMLHKRFIAYPGDLAEAVSLLNEANELIKDFDSEDENKLTRVDSLESVIKQSRSKFREAKQMADEHAAAFELWTDEPEINQEDVHNFRSLVEQNPDQAVEIAPKLVEYADSDYEGQLVFEMLTILAKRRPAELVNSDVNLKGILIDQLESDVTREDAIDALEVIAESNPEALENSEAVIASVLNDVEQEGKRQIYRILGHIGSNEAIVELREARRDADNYELRTEIGELIQTARANQRQPTVNVDEVRQQTPQSEIINTSDPKFESRGELPNHKVLQVLGSGGNADVKKIRLENSNEIVALKVPRWQGTLSETIVEEFRSEAATWARIDDHNNIVDVLGSGAIPYPWILLEYMPDGSLRERIANKPLQLADGVNLLLQLCSAVRHAHRHGIVHGDLKPENVLFDEGTAKIGDWGLAKVLLKHSTSIEGMTPTYAAPEQLDPDQYGDIDNRTDVYQLGIIAYELLTGTAPYERTNPAGTITSILSDEPTPLSDRNPALPSLVDETVLTAINKNKPDRYESVLYFRDNLQEIV